MQLPAANSRRARSGQEGYLFLTVIFMVALVSLGLAMAATQIATDIRRDKEQEFYYRGMEYQKAIRRYYRKFNNTYPGSLDALEKSNNMRFLRKRYKDPITGGDFRLIHMGEAKLKPVGFFGEPIANAGVAGTNILSGTSGSTIAGAQPIAGSNNNSTSGNSASGTDGSGSTTATSGGTSATSFTGGGAIMGVSSNSSKQSIREYRKQKHYNEWEFVYDPTVEQLAAQNAAASSPGSVTQKNDAGSAFGFGNSGGGTSTTGGTSQQ